ncbi:hypothetical protein J2X02_002606 [Pseudoxanthomonas japonensis]|nr:hypothetical protein [Pseudoxanthomonas japonensis]
MQRNDDYGILTFADTQLAEGARMLRGFVSIGVILVADGVHVSVCTLLGRRGFLELPEMCDVISFPSQHSSRLNFEVWPLGGSPATEAVMVEVESARGDPLAGVSGHDIYVYGFELVVPTLEDARELCDFMQREHGFEIDRYSINALDPDA